jgi:FMN-dependent NADH-azoreductase
MSNLLYIKASPMGELSYSEAVAEAFVESYKQNHPGDKIKTINLFEKKLPEFDFKAASAKYKIMHNKEHSAEDKKIWGEIVSIIEEFKSANKYIMSVPMWNFCIPYRLKQYIDIIVQPRLTFTANKDGGYEGLVKNKPIFIAYARGGEYPPGTPGEAFDLQKKYLELILGFIGFSDIRPLVVEPTLAAGPDVAKQKRDEAIEKARQMAKEF